MSHLTCRAVVDFNLLEDDKLAPATLNALYVSGIAEAPGGAAPLNLPGHYDYDTDAIRAYAKAAATPEGFSDWLAGQVLVQTGAAA